MFGSWPFQVGRCVGLNRFVLLTACVMISGMPLWNVRMPFTCQPPSTALTTPFQPLPNRRP